MIIKSLVITLIVLHFHCISIRGQQASNPWTFFSKIADLKEMEQLRINSRADSSAIFQIFTDSFAAKALAIKRRWDLNRFNIEPFKNTLLDSNFKNKSFKEIEVYTYSFNKFNFYYWFDTKKNVFKNKLQKFYDIDRGDGSMWIYFARYWTYIDGKWVTFEDLPSFLYLIFVEDENYNSK